MCDNWIKLNDALDREKQNILNNVCVTCYREATKQKLVSNELETSFNSEMIVEGDKEKK